MKSAQSVLLSGLGSSSVLLSVRGVGVDGGGGVGGRGHHVRHSGSVPSMQVLYDSYAQSSRSKVLSTSSSILQSLSCWCFQYGFTTRAREVLWVEEEKSCLGAVAHIVGGLGAIANRVVVVQGVPEVGLALLEGGNLLLEVGDGLVVVAGVSSGNVAVAGGWSAVASSVSSHNIGHHPSQDVQDRNPEQGQKEEQAKGSDDQGRDQVDRQVGIGEEDPRGLFHLLSNNLILK